MANILPDSDERKQKYIEFGESQLNYILGDNPLHINFVVRTEENSPKSVHHRDVHLLMMEIVNQLKIHLLYGIPLLEVLVWRMIMKIIVLIMKKMKLL